MAFTIKELASIADVFPIDAEMCIRELNKEDIVRVNWVTMQDEDAELFVVLGKNWEVFKKRKPQTSNDPPDPMYR